MHPKPDRIFQWNPESFRNNATDYSFSQKISKNIEIPKILGQSKPGY
jgi:hypothetical protein